MTHGIRTLPFSKKTNPDSIRIVEARTSSDFALHNHDFFEIGVVISGQSLHELNGKTYSLQPGDVFVLKKSDVHALRNPQDLHFFNIKFEECVLANFESYLKTLPGYYGLFFLEPYYQNHHPALRSTMRIPISELEQVQCLLQQLEQESKKRQAGYELMTLTLLLQFIVYLAREYMNTTSIHNQIADKNNYLELTTAISYIHNHYTENITLKALAKSANLSPTRFINVFKGVFQTSPIDYIITLRIQKSCELLKDSQKSITQIAYDTGFTDSNYFSRIFKQKMDHTPSAYRKLLAN